MKYYTVIDFNEVDMKIYLPQKSNNTLRPLGRGEYHFLSTEIEDNNCFVI